MDSANSDTANFERTQVRWRGDQRRTKRPNIKYDHLREEVRKETSSIYHTRTKQQIADSPSQKYLLKRV
jgi:hypothetical protein